MIEWMQALIDLPEQNFDADVDRLVGIDRLASKPSQLDEYRSFGQPARLPLRC